MPTTAAPSDHATDHATDLAAIEAVIAGVAAGIEARDPDACVARFTADARSVTDRHVVGREAIRRAHVAAFAADAVPVRARFEILDVLFVRPDVAVVTTGAYRAAPGEPIDRDAPPTIVTWTLVRDDELASGGDWWIAARQFTKVAG